MRIATVAALVLLLQAASAQEAGSAPAKARKDPRPLADRLWFGGGVGLQFGSFTVVQLEPMVGYKVDQAGRFSLGTGITYWYFSNNNTQPRTEFNAYGYRFFSRYRPIDQAFLHAEFLNLNREQFFGPTDRIQRIWVPHLLVGGGYIERFGGNTSFTLQVLWEVLQDPNSVYFGRGPIFGGGVGVGF